LSSVLAIIEEENERIDERKNLAVSSVGTPVADQIVVNAVPVDPVLEVVNAHLETSFQEAIEAGIDLLPLYSLHIIFNYISFV
jgi:hypothetical protein